MMSTRAELVAVSETVSKCRTCQRRVGAAGAAAPSYTVLSRIPAAGVRCRYVGVGEFICESPRPETAREQARA